MPGSRLTHVIEGYSAARNSVSLVTATLLTVYASSVMPVFWVETEVRLIIVRSSSGEEEDSMALRKALETIRTPLILISYV
jgi:hypothetical protein